MTIKIKIWNLVTDTDFGTNTRAFASREEAEANYIEGVHKYVRDWNEGRDEEDQRPLPETVEEAGEEMDFLSSGMGWMDTFYLEEQTIELGPKPPAEGLQRFYVVKAWDNFPEGGTCGEIIWAKDHDDAKEQMIEIMRSYRDYEADGYVDQWETIDCWPLDDFIERNLAA